jgi:hypothetical protein
MEWIKDRIRERTSLDGIVLVAMGGVVLLMGSVAEIAAYASIAYGIFTIVKKG